MSIRTALLPLLCLGLWSCGDDDDGPTAPVVDPREAAADSMIAAADAMVAAAGSMEAAADSLAAAGDEVLRPSGELLPWDLSAIVSIDQARSMPQGMPLYLRTEFANGELADLEMRFVAVVDDFLPPMPVIMVEASDPILIQLGGIAQGMSGSPVFSEEGTWGAIAYGFSAQDSPPYYFFATPIEWVIGQRGTLPAGKPAATWGGARITPLEVPLVVTGLNPAQPQPGGRPSPWSGAVSAALTQEPQESFEAGRPLAVGLLLGEITGGSIGTISYVDGDRVYGFGHPMNQSGRVELPIIEARILGEISNLSAPFKFATLNPTVRGTLTEDRLPAVSGVLGEGPELIAVTSRYIYPSGVEEELVHRMPARIDPSNLLAIAAFSPLFNRLENEGNHSVRVTTDISFAGTDSTLSRSRLYAAPNGRLLGLISAADFDLFDALAQLTSRNDYALGVREAEVLVEVISEPRFAQVVEVSADTVVSPGDVLTVTTSMRVGRRRDREIEVDINLPDTLPPGVYQLEAGSAASLPDVGGEGDPFFGFFDPGFGGGDGEETLEDAFARLNEEDGNVQLKARVTFVMPLPVEPPEGEPPPDSGGQGFGDLFPQDPGPPPTASAQEEVDLYLAGTASLEVKVVAE